MPQVLTLRLVLGLTAAARAPLQAEDSDDEPPDSDATAHDYLLPFLPPGMALAGGAGSLTREQALAVRERCLRALKDRLIERANIIQVSRPRTGGGSVSAVRLQQPTQLRCA